MNDYFIVGLGLSGAALAARLEEKGRSFKVFDNGKFNSSQAAGGMMNPVILKRFTLAWNADTQMELAVSSYRRLERRLDISFLSAVKLYRKFSSVEEQNNWFSAADHPRLEPFLDTNLEFNVSPSLSSEYGFGKVNNAKRLDTTAFLNAYSRYLAEKGLLEVAEFDFSAFQFGDEFVEYKGEKAKKIIFCQGFGMKKNPYFNYLPLVGNKGEYLIVKSPNLKLSVVVKSSVFVSPLRNDFYAVGATYNNSDKTPEPTLAAREELETKLSKLISVPYEVVDQIVGIRPSTGDRRPLVGQHPEHKNLYCCNGFGSRGVLIAPSVSADLLAFIEEGKQLPSEIDITRFRKRYGKYFT